jgi:hypothetical protein
MGLNVFTPHISQLLIYSWALFRRWLDRKNFIINQYFRLTKKEYFQYYVGPRFDIDIRYSQLLTTIFITILFSPGLPILYLFLFLYVLFTFWIDKILTFRYYRKPPLYDLYLAKTFNMILLFGMIIHYLIAIWVYGQPSIISNNTSTALDQLSKYVEGLFVFSQNSFAGQVVRRLTLPHNILCILACLVLIAVIILRLTIVDFFFTIIKKCYQAFYDKQRDRKTLEIGLALPFKDLYRNYELRKIQYLRLMKKNKSGKNVSLLKKYMKLGINYDREFIKYKLEKLNGQDYSDLNHNFDMIIKDTIMNIPKEDNQIMVGDVSYNISVSIFLNLVQS